MSSDTVSALHGSTFVVSDRRGDVDASPSQPHGLFHMDTRFLSRWQITIDGAKPDILSVDDLQYFETRYFLAPSTGTIYENSSVSVVRNRAVGDGFYEDLTIMNHRPTPLDVQVRVEAGSDFADLFEIKDEIKEKKGNLYTRTESNRLVLGYRRENFVRETWITPTEPARVDERGFTFKVHVEPHGKWSTGFDVVTAVDGWDETHEHAKYGRGEHRPQPNGPALEEWMANAPELVSSWAPLERIYLRSLVDLAALRFYPKLAPGPALPAAGLALVHGSLRSRQHHHELSGAPVRLRAGAHDARRARRAAGHEAG